MQPRRLFIVLSCVETSAVASTVGDLYRTNRLSLLRLAVFLVADRETAEDLVQDAFAGLQQNWSRLMEPAAAGAYLRRLRAAARGRAPRGHRRTAQADAQAARGAGAAVLVRAQ
jgi:DNA-directed RNA polymerase specialized sigma24 family protein